MELKPKTKDLSRNNLFRTVDAGLDLVVPVPLEFVAADLDQCKLIVRDFDASLVGFRVQLGVNLESGSGGGRRNEVDDGLKAPQRLSTPILSDIRE